MRKNRVLSQSDRDNLASLSSAVTRASGDIVSDKDSITAIEKGQRRQRNVAVCTPPDFTVSATDPANIAVARQFEIGGTMLGYTAGNIYAYISDAWASVAVKQTAGSIQMVWGYPDSDVVIWAESSDPYSIYRGTLEGTSITNITLVEQLSTNGDILGRNNFYAYSSGNAIFGEYTNGGGTSANDVQAYIVTNSGLTWTSVKTIPNGHIHSVYYDEDTDTFFISVGDSQYNQILYSTDKGATWNNYTGHEVGDYGGQPVGLCAYNGKLICGSDVVYQIYSLDIDGGTREQLYTELPPYQGQGYVFHIFKLNGVLYACSWDNSGSNQQAIVLVSPDGGQNWATWIRFDQAVIAAEIGGVDADGDIWFRIKNHDGSITQCVATEPTVSTVKALYIGDECTNLLTADHSNCVNDDYWAEYESGTSIAEESGGGRDGSGSVKLVWDSTHVDGTATYDYIVLDSEIDPTVGSDYSAVVGLRVFGAHESVQLTMLTKQTSATTLSTDVIRPAASGEWLECYIPAFTMPVGTTQVGIEIKVNKSSTVGGDGYVEVDHIAIFKSGQMHDWIEGGTTRKQDHIAGLGHIDVGGTHIQAVRMLKRSDQISEDMAVRSYIIGHDPTTYTELFYDKSENKFTLAIIDGGTPGTPAAIDAEYWLDGALIFLAVTYDYNGGDDTWKLYMINGQGIQSATSDGGTNIPTAAGYGIYFPTRRPATTEKPLPFELVGSWAYTLTLTESEIEAECAKIVTNKQKNVYADKFYQGV